MEETRAKNYVRISKTMSFILRHGAEKLKIPIRSDGFCLVKDLVRTAIRHDPPLLRVLPKSHLKYILSSAKLKHCTLQDIKTVVAQDSKTRFALSQIDIKTGRLLSETRSEISDSIEWCIRANQGHSLPSLERVAMTLIQSADEIPTVVHGTFEHIWPTIQAQGLSRMTRLHIHFATGLFQDPNVKSGMRKSANVFIYIDVGKAMQDGIVFYKSANNVVLSSGNDDGFILPIYFEKVVNSKGESLLL